jgi:hypothetical protein
MILGSSPVRSICRWAVIAAVLLTNRAATNATELFVDRQFQPDGSEIDRVFQANNIQSLKTIDENHAAKLALDWVARYYQATKVTVLSATLQTFPARFWIIRTLGNSSGRRDLFYSVILADGEIVEPRVIPRKTDFAQLGENLGKSAPKLEIHGEMDFEFSTGKGSGNWRPGFNRGRP